MKDSRFEWAIRAEFAAMHIMHEKGLNGPLDLYLNLGYDCQMNSPKLWNAIQTAYELQIAKCLKDKCGNRQGFKFIAVRPLE
jgi:hypothetical protein